jgi:aspartyl protease family protein
VGHIWVTVRVGSEDGSRFVETRALVDTGATLTVTPRGIAVQLGLRVTGKSRVETGLGLWRWIGLELTSRSWGKLISCP